MVTTHAPLALLIVRIAAAGNMLIHGIARLSLGTVPNFDEYLQSLGFPPYTAWAITIFELIGSIAIMIGRWVTPLSLVFCIQLIVGIVLIHFSQGWFVVGAGRNGMEYSVLLIICFLVTALVNSKK
jgi:putative oxidoreductase